jgi:hypothetical protein
VFRCCFHVYIDFVGCWLSLCARFCVVGSMCIAITIGPKMPFHYLPLIVLCHVVYFRETLLCLFNNSGLKMPFHYLPDFLHKSQNTIHIFYAMFELIKTKIICLCYIILIQKQSKTHFLNKSHRFF